MKTFTTVTDKDFNTAALKENEQFIYETLVGSFVAIKRNGGAILLNGSNEFIVAKEYKNCFSIGSGVVNTYKTFEDAVENYEKEIERL